MKDSWSRCPTANKEAYRTHASDAAPLFREFGATRMVEAWGDDVKRGKVTDFYGAVQAKEDESVVFSWFEYPDRATRDAANEKMMSDPRMEEMGANMPFDGQRMIYSGFDSMIDERAEGATGYVDGFIVPVPEGKRQAYRDDGVQGLPPSSRNMARSAWSRPGATTSRTARSPTIRRR